MSRTGYRPESRPRHRAGPGADADCWERRDELDLVAHARNGAVDVICLVSGDDDLTEAVEEAQGHGVQVVLLAVPDGTGRTRAVSRLQREADGLETLLEQDLDTAVLPVRTPKPETVPSPSPQAASPSPAILAARARQPDSASAGPTPQAALMYSSDSGASEESVDPSEDGLIAVIDSVCEGVLESWTRTATLGERAQQARDRPFIPPDVDRALLLDLSSRIGYYDLDEQTRFDLRKRFWLRVDGSAA